MIKNILFDFGAVLLPIDESLTWDSFVQLGSLSSLAAEREIFQHYECGKLDTDEFLAELQPHFFRKNIFKPDLATAWNAMIISPIQPEAIDLLRKLRPHYRLFLVSNTNALHMERIRQLSGPFSYRQFMRHFHAVYLSHEIGHRKPDEALFQKILKKHKIKAEESLFVDDKRINVKSARALGLKGWHFKPERDDITEIWQRLELRATQPS